MIQYVSASQAASSTVVSCNGVLEIQPAGYWFVTLVGGAQRVVDPQTFANYYAAAGAGVATSKIAEVAVTATAATVQFTSIPQGYRSLSLSVVARTMGALAAEGMILTANGDTISTYVAERLYGLAATAGATAFTSTIADVPGAQGLANAFGLAVVDIFDYATVGHFTSAFARNARPDGTVQAYSWLYESTAAVTSLSLSTQSGAGFAAGSVFSLYGVQ